MSPRLACAVGATGRLQTAWPEPVDGDVLHDKVRAWTGKVGFRVIDNLKLTAAGAFWKLGHRRPRESALKNICAAIRADGCYVLENFLPVDATDHIARRIEHAYVSRPDCVCRESNQSDERIYAVERLDSALSLDNELSLSERVFDNFDYGAKHTWFQMVGRITYRPDNLGSGSGWHRDSPFTHQLKAMVYLSDVTEANGPFQYVKGSHTKRSILAVARRLSCRAAKYRFAAAEVDALALEGVIAPPTTITGRRGTMVLADTRGLHRGMPLVAGSRLALTRYYFPNGVPKDFERLYPRVAVVNQPRA